MFSSNLGKFADINCPLSDKLCTLPNCLFSHKAGMKLVQRKRRRKELSQQSRPSIETQNIAPNIKDAEKRKESGSVPKEAEECGDVKVLTPTYVPISPAIHATRSSFLVILHKEYTRLGHPTARRAAIGAEEKLAKSTKRQTYPAAMKRTIQELRKKSQLEELEPKKTPGKEDISKLQNLVLNKKRLRDYGYTLEPPPFDESQIAGHTWVACDRCSMNFDVNGISTCKYHWGRAIRTKRELAEKTYTCCGGITGSEPCLEASRHVYKITDPARLHFLLPFVSTRKSQSALPVIALDCEMTYTSLGTELSRITIVDLQGNKIIDDLIVPVGEMWDLNTQFSGIQSMEKAKMTFTQLQHELLHWISEDTILILHGGENDLTSLRLIHSNIIDTAALYSHPSGPPFKYSLKDLARRYLGRQIQEHEHDVCLGHNSYEDSIATLDLVLKYTGFKG